MKWDPARVAQDMEMLTVNASYVFDQDECLSQGQIKSYFSRLALKQRSQQQMASQKRTRKYEFHAENISHLAEEQQHAILHCNYDA